MKNSIIKTLLNDLHKVNQLNNKIVKQLGKMFNFDAEKYCSDYGIIYNIVEDNPVPQFKDKLLDEIFDMCFDKTTQKGQIAAKITIFRKGVETDNEQPIIHKCTCCGKQYAQTKVCYCKE